jgi:2-amino-4-hydroxy-6-hydroxymethyldihydropteridine diphosphokinase
MASLMRSKQRYSVTENRRRRSSVAYIGLGSNRGDRQIFIAYAIKRFARAKYVRITGYSGLYASQPVGVNSEVPFLNMVLKIDTKLKPQNLLDLCRQIEHDAGRPPGTHNKSRVLDLDILFYDTIVSIEEGLVLPHPAVHMRKFMLLPLRDLNPEYVHPILNKSIQQLLDECQDTHWVIRTY